MSIRNIGGILLAQATHIHILMLILFAYHVLDWHRIDFCRFFLSFHTDIYLHQSFFKTNIEL